MDTEGTVISEDVRQFLVNVPIFGTLTEQDMRTLEAFLDLVEVPPGRELFQQGDAGNCVYFITGGVLEVNRSLPGSAGFHLELQRGSSIGEMSLIDQLPRSATVRARTAANLVSLERAAFDQLLAKHPEVATKILKGIARLLSLKLRDTSDRYATAITDHSIELPIT